MVPKRVCAVVKPATWSSQRHDGWAGERRSLDTVVQPTPILQDLMRYVQGAMRLSGL